MSVRWVVCMLLFGCASSCAQPQLIENSKLNEGRIHDIVKSDSDATGYRETHPLSVKLIDRTELSKILLEDAAATIQSDA